MGGEDWKEKVDRTPFIVRISAVTILLFLPALTGYFSWTIFFIPLVVFFLLGHFEEERVYAHIMPAFLAGGLLALSLSSLPAFLMAASLIPVGHALSYAAKREHPIWRGGLTACLTLLCIWFLGGVTLDLFLSRNLYQEIISGLDSVLVSTFRMYQNSEELAPELTLQLEEAIRQLRVILPKIFPAITVNTVIITIWLNLLLGNWLLRKSHSGQAPWPCFRQWRLPDKLVWILIGAGFGSLLPLPGIQIVSLNSILILGLVYGLQGLAVLAFLLHKWEVPVVFQVFVFSLILLQTYSVIFLALLGLVDIWLNIRRDKR